jgi:hypothetical protein
VPCQEAALVLLAVEQVAVRGVRTLLPRRNLLAGAYTRPLSGLM